MHDRASYATACASAAIGNAQPINDPLGLLPEHLNTITFKWNAHLIKQKISGNYLRILNAIYHQTIDFNKWEDDLAGKRLQQLTHIRYDHSNFILKRLYESNIILKRKGSFGSIVSINFDFSTWGKQYKQDEPHDANNDPSVLLSEEIRNNPIDAGMDLGLSDDFTAPAISTEKTTAEIENIQTEKSKPNTEITEKPHVNHNTKQVETPEILNKKSTVIDPVTQKVETLEEVIEQEVQRFQSEKQKALEAQISDLKQRLVNQSELEKQFVEQNQYIQTIQDQQSQQSEKLAQFKNIEQEAQAYLAEYNKQIDELKQTVQQQQASEQTAQEYAIQQQQVMEQTLQQNADLQAEQALQQSKIAAYQTQMAQTEAKIKAEYQAKIAQAETKIKEEYQAKMAQAETKHKTEQGEKSELEQQNKTSKYTDESKLDKQSYHAFIQAEFPIPEWEQLHVSPTVIDAVIETTHDIEIDPSDYNQSESDSDQDDHNQSKSKLNNLHYADNIPVELRKDLAELLPESTQNSQKLLDIFSAQLSNPNQPIQNPIVDFAHLVQRLQIGELDIEDTETLIARARGDKTPQQYEFERLFTDLEEIRHTAELNKQHYLEYYQRGAEDNHISVEEYIEDQDQMEFWQELCSTLKQSECAIRDLMAQDT